MRVRRLMVGMAAVTAWLGLTVPAQAAIVGSKPIPSYQTNGRVVVVVVSGTTAYIGGKFTSVRPAGAAAGTGEVARNHVAAIDLNTGNVLPWNPNASAVVDAIRVSGSTVYIGGSFATVGGKSRARIAAVDASTGAVLTAFKASVNAEVRAIEVSNGRLYLGGAFTTPRSYAAAFDPTTGAFQSGWAPTVDGPVDAILTSGGNHIVLGGAFNTLNGASSSAVGAVDPASGATQPWTWHGPPRSGTHPFDVVALASDGTHMYGAGTGNGGSVMQWDNTGNLLHIGGANGNVVGVALLDGFLYIAGHFTAYCGPIMGFNGCPNNAGGAGARQKLAAINLSTWGLDPWHPSANSSLGTFTISAGSGFVATGGDFTKLGGVAQQGFGAFKE